MDITRMPPEPAPALVEDDHIALAVPDEETTGVAHEGKWYQAILGIVRVPGHMVEELLSKHGFKKPADAAATTTDLGDEAWKQ